MATQDTHTRIRDYWDTISAHVISRGIALGCISCERCILFVPDSVTANKSIHLNYSHDTDLIITICRLCQNKSSPMQKLPVSNTPISIQIIRNSNLFKRLQQCIKIDATLYSGNEFIRVKDRHFALDSIQTHFNSQQVVSYVCKSVSTIDEPILLPHCYGNFL